MFSRNLLYVVIFGNTNIYLQIYSSWFLCNHRREVPFTFSILRVESLYNRKMFSLSINGENINYDLFILQEDDFVYNIQSVVNK